jgi:coenzyme F420-0:L-glutamate ligase/coenzyme F420-1:gamma-L-glutamate ligase
MTLTLTPLKNFPLVFPGQDLADLIWQASQTADLNLEDGDIFVIAQKIVSKSEGRLLNLNTIQPSAKAIEIARITQKDPRFIELVLRESNAVLRTRPGTIIVEHKLGFVCANAGIDHSNVNGPWGDQNDWVLLLPENPDQSAHKIRETLENLASCKLGIVIIDSHGRAWRMGIVGTTIGVSGVPALVDLRGTKDMFGYELRVTQVAAVDELAAAASLVMGQAAEGVPVVHVRGFPYPFRESHLGELIRPLDQDMFR